MDPRYSLSGFSLIALWGTGTKTAIPAAREDYTRYTFSHRRRGRLTSFNFVLGYS
jgi:hypothetical protein